MRNYLCIDLLTHKLKLVLYPNKSNNHFRINLLALSYIYTLVPQENPSEHVVFYELSSIYPMLKKSNIFDVCTELPNKIKR